MAANNLNIAKKVCKGDRIALAQAITIIENEHPKYKIQAKNILNYILPFSGNSRRIGISGSPGVGKSTFIEALGMYYIGLGKKVAVLAIDPSSSINKGSIMGDKTRMEKLSTHSNAFIRPSPSGKTLGGVTSKTRETIFLCEAAGYDIILIETVGVGQSETEVHSMTDLFCLLLLPGAGDELQGIKRGIVELADIAIVNKIDRYADGIVNSSISSYKNAMHLFSKKESGTVSQVLKCSSINTQGIREIAAEIESFFQKITKNGFLKENRHIQSIQWFDQSLKQKLISSFFQNNEIQKEIQTQKDNIIKGRISPNQAAIQLLNEFLKF